MRACRPNLSRGEDNLPFAVVVSVALVVFATGKTGFAPALKGTPIEPGMSAAVIVALAIFGAVPFWEEAWRCWRQVPVQPGATFRS